MGTNRDEKRMFVVAAVAVGATLIFVGLTLAGWLPGSGGVAVQWTEQSVSLAPGANPCHYVNSSTHVDRFCIILLVIPAAGLIINGTFDHGPGTTVSYFVMGQGPACAQNQASCPTAETWTSPDGTGRVYWPISYSATLEALY